MIVKPTKITLSDGTERNLLFTWRSFELIMEKTGRLPQGVYAAMGKDFAVYIWAALNKAERAATTPEDIGDLILPAMVYDLSEIVKEALLAFFPKNDQTPEKTEPLAAN